MSNSNRNSNHNSINLRYDPYEYRRSFKQNDNDVLDFKSNSEFWAGNLDFVVDTLTRSKVLNSIKNFVNILTKRNDIEVTYGYVNRTNGLSITIDADPVKKGFKIDPVVGSTLHEASHIMYTDFKIFDKYPILYTNKLLMIILNYIEDRRIDDLVKNEAPGYIEYYNALYELYFNNHEIQKGFASYTKENVESYLYHIINMLSSKFNSNALIRLFEICSIIDINNISRLTSTEDAYEVAQEVVAILMEVQKNSNDKGNDQQSKNGSSNQTSSNQDSSNQTSSNQDSSNQTDINDLISNYNKILPIDSMMRDKNTGYDEMFQSQVASLKDAFTNKKISVLPLTEVQEIQLYSTFNYEIVNKDNSIYHNTNELTIIELDKRMANSGIYADHINLSNDRSCVLNGMVLGKLLGNRLKLHSEVNKLTISNQVSGKLFKRNLHRAGQQRCDLFKTDYISTYKRKHIHISIDGSGSMLGRRFKEAITCAVAIAKAASMQSNIDVVIDVRYSNPFSCVIAYDSTKHNITKLHDIYMLVPEGDTPELMITDKFIKSKKYCKPGTASLNSYYILFTDGDPNNTTIEFAKQVLKNVSNLGIKFKAFSIDSLTEYFKIAYNKNGSKVESKRLPELAKDLNKLFLNEN